MLFRSHDVVRRRADFHRLLGNVEVGELLELVIHARQLALDVTLAVRNLALDPRDIEENAAVRTPPPFLDFSHNAPRHMISGNERSPRYVFLGSPTVQAGGSAQNAL